jgi:hypothetical protein
VRTQEKEDRRDEKRYVKGRDKHRTQKQESKGKKGIGRTRHTEETEETE